MKQQIEDYIKYRLKYCEKRLKEAKKENWTRFPMEEWWNGRITELHLISSYIQARLKEE